MDESGWELIKADELHEMDTKAYKMNKGRWIWMKCDDLQAIIHRSLDNILIQFWWWSAVTSKQLDQKHNK